MLPYMNTNVNFISSLNTTMSVQSDFVPLDQRPDHPLDLYRRANAFSRWILAELKLRPRKQQTYDTQLQNALHCIINNLRAYLAEIQLNPDWAGSGIWYSTSNAPYKQGRVTARSEEVRAKLIGLRQVDKAFNILAAQSLVYLVSEAEIRFSKDSADRIQKDGKGKARVWAPTARFISMHDRYLLLQLTMNAIGARKSVIKPEAATSNLAATMLTESDSDEYLILHYGLIKVNPTRRKTGNVIRADAEADPELSVLADKSIPDVANMTTELQTFNRCNIAHDWRLAWHDVRRIEGIVHSDKLGDRISDGYPLIKGMLIYSRIFSRGSLELGGRYYAWLTSKLDRNLRREVTVNGEPLVDFDFRSLHVRLAYDLSRNTPPGDDCNMIDDPSMIKFGRPLIKLLTLTLINLRGNGSREKQSTDKSLPNELANSLNGYDGVPGRLAIEQLRRKRELDYLAEIKAYEVYQKLKSDPVKRIPKSVEVELVAACVAAIREFHKPITASFCSDFGVKAQFVESNIAREVMFQCTLRNIPLMVMHDGMLCPESRGDELMQIMRAAYALVVGVEIPVGAIKREIRPQSGKRGAA